MEHSSLNLKELFSKQKSAVFTPLPIEDTVIRPSVELYEKRAMGEQLTSAFLPDQFWNENNDPLLYLNPKDKQFTLFSKEELEQSSLKLFCGPFWNLNSFESFFLEEANQTSSYYRYSTLNSLSDRYCIDEIKSLKRFPSYWQISMLNGESLLANHLRANIDFEKFLETCSPLSSSSLEFLLSLKEYFYYFRQITIHFKISFQNFCYPSLKQYLEPLEPKEGPYRFVIPLWPLTSLTYKEEGIAKIFFARFSKNFQNTQEEQGKIFSFNAAFFLEKNFFEGPTSQENILKIIKRIKKILENNFFKNAINEDYIGISNVLCPKKKLNITSSFIDTLTKKQNLELAQIPYLS